MNTHKHTCIHAYINAYIHTHTQARTHTYTHKKKKSYHPDRNDANANDQHSTVVITSVYPFGFAEFDREVPRMNDRAYERTAR